MRRAAASIVFADRSIAVRWPAVRHVGELATGLVAALVGGVAGIVTSMVSNLLERRRKIDEDIRTARLQVYESLWRKFGFIPRWPRGSVTPTQLQDLSGSLRDWYFGTTPETALAVPTPKGGDQNRPGGMYLSNKAREKYNDFQTAIQDLAKKAKDRTADDPISEEAYDQLQEKVTALRAEITEDLSSRRRDFLTR